MSSFWRWIIPSLSRQKTRKQIKNQNRLSQYIARHPVSLNKIIYIPEKAKVLYKTKYNDYFGENIQLFTATDFIARFNRTILPYDKIVELPIHIPPKHKHLGNPSKRPEVVLLIIMASIPAEVEERTAASSRCQKRW